MTPGRDHRSAHLQVRAFGLQAHNFNEVDDEGVVFGHPEQIEFDIIIKNGVLLICELKSSIDKAGMYGFEHKARFYDFTERYFARWGVKVEK